MAKEKTEVVPNAKNPVVGSLIKSMFDSSETDPDRKAEDLEAARESAAEDAAARKPADDILDDSGADDDEPEPPRRETKPKEPAKPVEEKSAETKPAEEKPAEEAPRMVPLGELIDLRMERKQLQDRLKAAEDELGKLKAAPAKPKPEVTDPEPPKDKVLEHDEWEKRDLRRQIQASNERLDEVSKKLTERDQIEQLRDMEERFDVMLEEEHEKYAAKNPEFKDKREFLKSRLIEQHKARGATQAQAEQLVKNQEREFCGVMVNRGRNFSEELSKQADAAGYEYYKTWKAQQKPAGGNGNGKAPSTSSAQDKIKAGQRREAAARSTSTAPSIAPAAPEDETMTAEKFGMLTSAQRRAYKKAHPDFELGQIMGASESSDGLF